MSRTGHIKKSESAARNSLFACRPPRLQTFPIPPSKKADGTSMTHHTRIRPFNTKDTYPEQNLDNDLCQAVVANGVVYLRGQIGQDLDTGESVGIGDVEAQADKAMANIKLL